jgi:UDP-N-acetyl-D-mannosaminuronate dehydrogenase
VFTAVEALRARGATVVVHDPMFSDAELAGYGFDAYHLGDNVDAAVVHTDHAEYRELRPKDLPGVRTIVDGRRLLRAQDWPEVTLRVVGVG